MVNHARGGKRSWKLSQDKLSMGRKLSQDLQLAAFMGLPPLSSCCKSDSPLGAQLTAFTGLPQSVSGGFLQTYFIATSFCLPVCLCIIFIACALGHQRGGLIPLEMHLQMIIRHNVGAGNQIHVLCKNKSS